MKNEVWTDHPEDYVRQRIEAFVAESPENRMAQLDGAPFFDAPLVGFADGDDPLFAQFKTIIGPGHLTPREWIAEAGAGCAAGRAAGSDAPQASLERLSVIGYILPITEETRVSNRAETRQPSLRWAHQRTHGEGFNKLVRGFIVDLLRQAGYLAIAPMDSERWQAFYEAQPGHNAKPPFSNWSERHAQFVAGLGTFSVNDGLITPRGIAHRCGSVITNLPLERRSDRPPRPYSGPYDYCLLLARGTCGVCIDRCPAGAISEAGHDKERCRAYMANDIAHLREDWGLAVPGCGLCQTAVPCEYGIPE